MQPANPAAKVKQVRITEPRGRGMSVEVFGGSFRMTVTNAPTSGQYRIEPAKSSALQKGQPAKSNVRAGHIPRGCRSKPKSTYSSLAGQVRDSALPREL